MSSDKPLIERLEEKWPQVFGSRRVEQPYNRDGPEAAAAIRELEAENAELRKKVERLEAEVAAIMRGELYAPDLAAQAGKPINALTEGLAAASAKHGSNTNG